MLMHTLVLVKQVRKNNRKIKKISYFNRSFYFHSLKAVDRASET